VILSDASSRIVLVVLAVTAAWPELLRLRSLWGEPIEAGAESPRSAETSTAS